MQIPTKEKKSTEIRKRHLTLKIDLQCKKYNTVNAQLHNINLLPSTFYSPSWSLTHDSIICQFSCYCPTQMTYYAAGSTSFNIHAAFSVHHSFHSLVMLGSSALEHVFAPIDFHTAAHFSCVAMHWHGTYETKLNSHCCDCDIETHRLGLGARALSLGVAPFLCFYWSRLFSMLSSVE